MADYTVADANRNQIGPIPESEVRALLKRGQINLDSLAWQPGMAEWEPLRSFSEFIDVPNDIPPAPYNPYAPPTAPKLFPDANSASDGIDLNIPSSIRAQAIADEVLRRDYQLDIFSCLGRAWNLVFSRDFWGIFGVSTLLGFVVLVSSFCYASIVVGGPLLGGLDLFFLKKIRRQEADLNTAFSGFSLAFSQLFLVYLVSSLLIGVGALLCILPGIYLATAWTFARVLVIDKKLDFWDAMECSRKVVHRHWLPMLGLVILSWIFATLGIFALLIGVLITFPIRQAAMMYAYEDIFHPRRNDPVHQ
jgi:GYF domain 2